MLTSSNLPSSRGHLGSILSVIIAVQRSICSNRLSHREDISMSKYSEFSIFPDTVVHRSEKMIISGYYGYIIEPLRTLFRGSAVAVQFVHHFAEFQRDEQCHESGHNSAHHVIAKYPPSYQLRSKFRVSTPIYIKYTIMEKNLIDGQYSPHERGFCKDGQFHHCLMQTEANDCPCILNRIWRRQLTFLKQ